MATKGVFFWGYSIILMMAIGGIVFSMNTLHSGKSWFLMSFLLLKSSQKNIITKYLTSAYKTLSVRIFY